MLQIHTSIIKTLAWFDIFSHPLTAQELHRNLWEPSVCVSFKAFLVLLCEVDGIEYKSGFYFLPGRESIIAQRQLGTPIIDTKLRIAKSACKKIRWIPFVQAMFVCNTVASATASEHSDIDVFVVIQDGRMWISRFLVTAVLSLFRLRRSGKCVANKICLSFFVTDAALDFSSIRLGSPDIYLAYWLTQLIPVYDPANVLQTIQQKNSWVRTYLPNAFASFHLATFHRVLDHAISRSVKRVLQAFWNGAYGNLIEQQAKKIQELKMKRNYDSVKDAEDSRVVISDTMLKFHENDQRAQYRKKWQEKILSLV